MGGLCVPSAVTGHHRDTQRLNVGGLDQDQYRILIGTGRTHRILIDDQFAFRLSLSGCGGQQERDRKGESTIHAWLLVGQVVVSTAKRTILAQRARSGQKTHAKGLRKVVGRAAACKSTITRGGVEGNCGERRGTEVCPSPAGIARRRFEPLEQEEADALIRSMTRRFGGGSTSRQFYSSMRSRVF